MVVSRAAIAHVHALHPSASVSAVGWSIGANVLVNLLAEDGAACSLDAAVSLCNPYNLTMGACTTHCSRVHALGS